VEPRRRHGDVHVAVTQGESTATGPNVPLTHLEVWLSSDEKDPSGLRAKLAATELPERHAFIWVDLRSETGAWRWLYEDELPTRWPTLPDEITHVWLASTAGRRWSPRSGWAHLDDVSAALDTTREMYGRK
jgi:hypothetical protein